MWSRTCGLNCWLSCLRRHTVSACRWRGPLAVVAIALGLLLAPWPAAAEPSPRGVQTAGARPAAMYRSALDRYCVACHNQRLRTANLALDGRDADLEHVASGAELWEKVVNKLRGQAMPPPGRPRPSPDLYDRFASWLEEELDRAAAANPNPGRPTIRRLNRTEYANSIRDLLSLDIDAAVWLPPDNLGFGFDNNADMLSISPGLLERYMSVATKISRLAVGDPTMRPVVEQYKVSSQLVQDDRVSEDLPFGSRGGISVRHYFPLSAEYQMRIRLQRDGIYNIRGLTEAQTIDLRVDGARIRTFTVGGAAGPSVNGSYRDGNDAESGLAVSVPVKAGTHRIGVSFEKRLVVPGGIVPARLPVANFILSPTARAIGFAELMGVAALEVSGPYRPIASARTPSRDTIFVCRPARVTDEERCAASILGRLAGRAYRRPPTADDLTALMDFYRRGRRGGDFDKGVEKALTRILIDPEFLFRLERDPEDVQPRTAYRLTDLQLASRLSFFLWSSIPDGELLDLASRGKLHDDRVLAGQVLRMLADRRASALTANFATQWLHLRNVRAVAPDVNLFPEFDENLREAFQRETELFVESQIREDHRIDDLLTSNETFLNERLARHYGVANVYGSHFRRVTVGDGTRGGLLGQGSILTLTSHATRTSPVVRGKWLLDNVLGAPPPAPPPNIPPLPDSPDDGKAASVRERLEQHRRNPVCASCHSRMDPLGFALENYDAIGKWRTVDEGGRAIDATGSLPDGKALAGAPALREYLRDRRREFAAAVASKLMTYALGRGVEYYDMPAVRRIVRDAADREYRWSAIVLGVVRSVPFQMRRTEP